MELLGCIAEHIHTAGLVAESISVPSWITAGANGLCAVCQLIADLQGWAGDISQESFNVISEHGKEKCFAHVWQF